ncbi:DUF1801 domain-containing protein [Occultella glacieicola]|uniref:DUF1801 domain-containing protein n=1 Tax=Occultella glacieicola TaxID=2518684 RepID=A0ABY2E997_9MICO|nr:DUF1801 domain-containing protein [Occultella glacieicola]TDE99086.1 DUF1801 domain-containing protein [Occultella glacieicola]
MAELKTRPGAGDVHAFIASIPDQVRRADAERLVGLMRSASGAEPVLWGPSIVGFGDRHLVYESGREIDWFEIGFSPRKAASTLYLDGAVNSTDLLAELGPHSTGKGCLYVKRLADVDVEVLRTLVERAVAEARGQE